MKLFSSLTDVLGGSDMVGEAPKPVVAPTGFGTLPQFGQDAFQQAINTGTTLSQNPSMFAPAGLTPEQLASLSTLSQGLNPISQEQFQQGISTFSNPYENQVVQNTIGDINTAAAGQRSDIGTYADAAGGFGGTRQALLESELNKNTQKNIGDVSSQLRSQGFQNASNLTLADLARQQEAATSLFGLGEVQRGINTQTQQAPIAANNYLASLAGSLPVGGGTTSYSPATAGLLGSGGAISPQILGGLAMAASDIRLKDNIKYIGKENDHDMYEFEYKWSPQRFVGVMAQDIKDKIPEAIKMIKGYMFVDYNKLNVKMRAI